VFSGDTDKPLVRLPSHTLSSVAAVCADFLGITPPLVEPSLKEGIVSIPGSLLQSGLSKDGANSFPIPAVYAVSEKGLPAGVPPRRRRISRLVPSR